MKYFVTLSCIFLLAACDSGHRVPGPNNYLTNCRVVENENSYVLLSDIVIPENYAGLLFEEGNNLTETVVFANNTVQIALFEKVDNEYVGTFTYCLRLVNITNHLSKDFLNGLEECCVFKVGPQEKAPEEPVEPKVPEEPISPALVCNTNFDGAASIVVELGNLEYAWLLSETWEELITEPETILELHLDPGEHVFSLVHNEITILQCNVIIPEIIEETPNNKERYWVCFNGNSLYLPYKAYVRHLELGGYPGPCSIEDSRRK